MVYCKLKQREEKRAVYSIGNVTSNMTGEAVFKIGEDPRITRQPEGEIVPIRYLYAAWQKVKERIDSGDFPEKFAYEIG